MDARRNKRRKDGNECWKNRSNDNQKDDKTNGSKERRKEIKNQNLNVE